MIEEFSFANFKAFAKKQRIPLKPITLIFGANSSGKSSIIQSLVWAQQALETGRLEFDHVGSPGEEIQLGGIENVLFKKSKEGRILIEFRFPAQEPNGLRIKYEIGMWTPLLKEKILKEPTLPQQLKAYEESERAFLDAENDFNHELTIGKFEVDEDGFFLEVRDGFDEHEIRQEWEPKLQALWETWKKEYNVHGVKEALERFQEEEWGPYCEMLMRKESAPVIFGFEISSGDRKILRAERTTFEEQLELTHVDLIDTIVDLKPETVLGTDSAQYTKITEQLKDGNEDLLNQMTEFLLSIEATDFEASSLQFVGLLPVSFTLRMAEESYPPFWVWWLQMLLNSSITNWRELLNDGLSSLVYLGPLRALPPRDLMGFSTRERTTGADSWIKLREDEELRAKVNQWMGAERLDVGYQFEANLYCGLEEAFNIEEDGIQGIFLRDRRDWDLNKQSFKEGFSRTGDVPPEEVAPDLHDQRDAAIKYWSERLERKIRDLRLNDSTNEVDVTHRDVGIGISQLIPIVVHALSQSNSLIAIEQPELHLHPALQTKLGDLFIHSALGKNGNRFIIETHSEHLILRILRRIRETTLDQLPDGELPLRPQDVCVLYVQRTEGGSEVVELPVTEDGDFEQDWPEGFFDERFEEYPD